MSPSSSKAIELTYEQFVKKVFCGVGVLRGEQLQKMIRLVEREEPQNVVPCGRDVGIDFYQLKVSTLQLMHRKLDQFKRQRRLAKLKKLGHEKDEPLPPLTEIQQYQTRLRAAISKDRRPTELRRIALNNVRRQWLKKFPKHVVTRMKTEACNCTGKLKMTSRVKSAK